MTPCEIADLLERYASKITKLPGVSRTNPHAFAEAKSELAGEMMREARAIRPVKRSPGVGVITASIQPGIRIIGRRAIAVELRKRA